MGRYRCITRRTILIQLDDQRNQVVNQGSLRNDIALVDS